MSKRNITCIKPEEPKFLKELKAKVGYKSGPTVDTKREALDVASDSDFEDSEDEQPTVVVLKPEHLTKDQAEEVKKQLEKEKDETPADLNEKILFKAPSKEGKSSVEEGPKKRPTTEKEAKKSKKSKKALLSFDEEEDDD